MTERHATITLKITSPIKRSTFGKTEADPVDQAVGDILHWSWSTRLQIDRLAQCVRSEFAIISGLPRLKARRTYSATTYNEHLVYVAAANLQRALNRAPRPLKPTIREAAIPGRQLRLLRDVYEHWDQLRAQLRSNSSHVTGAAAKLRAEFPEADPWTFTINTQTGDIVLAGVVSLHSLYHELRRLEARLIRRERARARLTNGPLPNT